MSEPDLRANPYVGLRPFFLDDSLYFFGREQQTEELLNILRQHHFLGVVGSSGCGKSSLVRAGLLPGLLGGFLVRDRDRWRTIQMKPGDAPLTNLASGLLALMGQTPGPESVTQLETELREGHTDAVIDFLAARLESNANVFLLVDQFEEIFAFRGLRDDDGEETLDVARRKERARRTAEAADFVDLLLRLSDQRVLPVYVVLTMRTDFLGDCDLFYGLPEALNCGRYLVPRMNREQLRDAIECPAQLLGADIAPRLMDHVLNELGDRFDRLPVLQHALLRTWDKRFPPARHGGRAWLEPRTDAGGGPVDLKHFEAAGSLEDALDLDAEAALKGLDIDVTERVFRRLTDTDASQRRVRAPARISELMATAGADRETVDGIVDRFEEDGRSFVHRSADGKPDDPRVDISHESLIRQWDRLRNWVDKERRSRDQYSELAQKARKWQDKSAAPLQDPELGLAVDWKAETSPSAGWAFRYSVADDDFECAMGYLDRSVEVRAKDLATDELQRRWKWIWHPLIFLLVALAATVAVASRSATMRSQDAARARLEAEATWSSSLAALSGPANAESVTPPPPATVSQRTEFARATVVSELRRLLQENYYLTFFVLAYFGLAAGGQRVHRWWSFDDILKGFIAAGGRHSVEVKATAVELPDARDAQDIEYASTVRRIAGAAIDFGVVLVFAVLVLFASVLLSGVSSYDHSYVLTRDSETVSGAFTQFQDKRIDVPQSEGATPWTLSFIESVTHTVAGDEAPTTYPVKPQIRDWDRDSSVSFPSGPFLTGFISRADEDWSLTLSAAQSVYSGSSTIDLEEGTIVRFPSPDPRAWELSYEFPNDHLELVAAFLAILVFPWFYGALQITSKRQATLGMRVAGIVRVDEHGKRLSFARASALYACRVLSLYPLFGLPFVFQPFNRKRQTLPDRITGSIVRRRGSSRSSLRSAPSE